MPQEIIRVIAAVIARADKLLVCRRPREKRHGGLWEFPGGKVEAGETDRDTAARELAEELGVVVLSAGSPEVEFQDPGSRFVIAFVPVVIGGEPECREHTALAWATLDELQGFALAPSDKKFVDSRTPKRS